MCKLGYKKKTRRKTTFFCRRKKKKYKKTHILFLLRFLQDYLSTTNRKISLSEFAHGNFVH